MTTYAERRQISFGADLNTAMRAWGREHGYAGKPGGWIYSITTGHTYTQGWWNVWSMNRESVLDWLTRKHTAFESFEQMLSNSPDYRPTIQLRNAETRCLAAAYDRIQELRSDPRRAETYYAKGATQ